MRDDPENRACEISLARLSPRAKALEKRDNQQGPPVPARGQFLPVFPPLRTRPGVARVLCGVGVWELQPPCFLCWLLDFCLAGVAVCEASILLGSGVWSRSGVLQPPYRTAHRTALYARSTEHTPHIPCMQQHQRFITSKFLSESLLAYAL